MGVSMGIQGRQAQRMVHVETLRRCQSATRAATQLLTRAEVVREAQAVEVAVEVAVAGRARDRMVPAGVETWTVCKQVSPKRVVCSSIFNNIPAGASGDRPIWCTQHPQPDDSWAQF